MFLHSHLVSGLSSLTVLFVDEQHCDAFRTEKATVLELVSPSYDCKLFRRSIILAQCCLIELPAACKGLGQKSFPGPVIQDPLIGDARYETWDIMRAK